MLIPSTDMIGDLVAASLSRRVNANSQHRLRGFRTQRKLIKKGEC